MPADTVAGFNATIRNKLRCQITTVECGHSQVDLRDSVSDEEANNVARVPICGVR